MFDIGNYSVWEILAFSAIGSALTFVLTHLSVGERAERYPAAAILGAVILQPWWGALTAGLAAHCVCAVTVRTIKHKPIGVERKMALWLSLGAMIVAQQFAMGLDNEAVMAAVRKGEAVSWARIESSNEVGKFVAENYRPCIEEKETFLQYMGRRFLMTSRVNDPISCKAAAIAVAKPKGDVFSTAVAAAIDDLPNKLELSTEAGAEIDRVARRWGI